jgi:hypothetical protein
MTFSAQFQKVRGNFRKQYSTTDLPFLRQSGGGFLRKYPIK